jgi:CheY-like chemotaxis protein
MADEKLVVLYLDDSRAALDAVRSALTAHGYDVITARSVLEAHGHVAKCDVVVIDFHMPDMNGAEALQTLTAACGQPPPLFYLYTIESAVASSYKDLGFNGAFTGKGNTDALVTQLGTAARIMRMRRFVAARRA